ncbi:IS1595 family transposase [Mesorhizobium sp. RSR380A]|uniref:IS1595 family transposase n=1 Tax=unclassified Mesorhizobium TaxID=325217 RepID=UPI0003CF5C27|nr:MULTISPECIES: IS1595 family transposase [unclassified Mesorhizobium]ESX47229.1 transposase IS1595 [Mesorhizobium sp. LSHC426A00]ESX56672.1 transposase IS1595 [Mesorhizobium sp. LSHC424B00]ESX71230.1 transposase IS1595 [Mesorhizobium sp. LSHC416B00]ESY48453.1 transposase IS1595 [Mesorhizobium sp. LNJC380A00]WJI61366.1 IS1595 family transposase [Mesorhizobium sp. C416B]
MSILSEPRFHNEEAAFERLEAIVWPEDPVCPKCGNCEQTRITRVTGATARTGLRRCLECKKQFTVKVGTVFESSHVPLHKWWQAAHLLASSKKGISAHQLHRTLQVQYKTAWFMFHRLREAMRDGGFSPMGGSGKIAEADETYIGRLQGVPKQRGGGHKNTVLTLVERSGIARSFHIDTATVARVIPIVRANIAKESALMTDEGPHYTRVGKEFAMHGTVNHRNDEYGRTERDAAGEKISVSTNTVEGFYSIFKRGIKGVYQHCGEHHLHRYLAEFDFRYSNRIALGVDDNNRTVKAMAGIVGKRLKYRDSSWALA